MNPPSTSKTGTGRSAVLAPDNFQTPFNVGLFTTVSGSATYDVEFSPDDPMDAGYVAASAKWYPVGGMYQADAAISGNLTVPCRGLSINITGGAGTVTLYTRQAGTR